MECRVLNQSCDLHHLVDAVAAIRAHDIGSSFERRQRRSFWSNSDRGSIALCARAESERADRRERRALLDRANRLLRLPH